MTDIIIKTGDLIRITIQPPTVIPAITSPIPLIGSGTRVLLARQPICLQGDELPPVLRVPLPYTAPPFVTPGLGTLSVILTPANLALRTMNGKPILIKGQPFVAQFQITAPAMQPTPAGPVPDPLLVKPGTAEFLPTTPTVRAG